MQIVPSDARTYSTPLLQLWYEMAGWGGGEGGYLEPLFYAILESFNLVHR